MKEDASLEYIPINIWDDYYEEGYIPEGKIQETYIYVEDYSFSLDEMKEILTILLDYMKNNLSLEGVKLWIELNDPKIKYPKLAADPDYAYMLVSRWEIKVEHLTHKRRYILESELNSANLSYNNLPFNVYSES